MSPARRYGGIFWRVMQNNGRVMRSHARPRASERASAHGLSLEIGSTLDDALNQVRRVFSYGDSVARGKTYRLTRDSSRSDSAVPQKGNVTVGKLHLPHKLGHLEISVVIHQQTLTLIH